MVLLKIRQKFGKYRIRERLASGGFAEVYRAYDTIEGIEVALKIPYPEHLQAGSLETFRKEIRIGARLDHPNVLPVKNAEWIDEMLVVAYRLGDETLADRLQRRLGTKRALSFAQQLLEGLAHAHGQRIVHCDVKPENLLLFGPASLRLTDFGIARFAQQTLKDGSGSGTIGYIAPEQAMGKPSSRSDVFSAGLVIYRMLAGELPEWPYQWPLPGHERLEERVPREVVSFLRRCLKVDQRLRFASAVTARDSFRRLLPRVWRSLSGRKARRRRH